VSIPAGLLEHVEDGGLVGVVHGLYTDSSSALGHGADIDDPHSVVIHELAQHETHDLHRHTSTA